MAGSPPPRHCRTSPQQAEIPTWNLRWLRPRPSSPRLPRQERFSARPLFSESKSRAIQDASRPKRPPVLPSHHPTFRSLRLKDARKSPLPNPTNSKPPDPRPSGPKPPHPKSPGLTSRDPKSPGLTAQDPGTQDPGSTGLSSCIRFVPLSGLQSASPRLACGLADPPYRLWILRHLFPG